MRINLTFILQIIHLIITYKILERLLFAPAFSMLQKRENEGKLLAADCLFEEGKIRQFEQQRHELLAQFQHRVHKEHEHRAMQLHCTAEFKEPDKKPLPQLTPELAEQVKAVITRKVLHE